MNVKICLVVDNVTSSAIGETSSGKSSPGNLADMTPARDRIINSNLETNEVTKLNRHVLFDFAE